MKIGSQEYAAPLGRGFRAGFFRVSLSIALGRGRKMREACMSHRRPKTNLVGQAEGPSQQGLRHDQQAMRNAGLVVETIPLSKLHTELLVRDRKAGDDADLADLMVSLRDIGLSNPVRVQARKDGSGFNLIQGYRRLEAYRRLLQETGSDQWLGIPSLIMPPQDGLKHLYRQMIDENIVRKELSLAEMAEAARNYASDPSTDAQTVEDAVPILFQSANYVRRSYIEAFARLLDKIGPYLKYPIAIERNLGLKLLRLLDADVITTVQIKAPLSNWENRSVSDELGVLRQVARIDAVEEPIPELIEQKAMMTHHVQEDMTTFDIRLPQGQVKCTGMIGRLEIRANRNFSRFERSKIERAMSTLMQEDS